MALNEQRNILTASFGNFFSIFAFILSGRRALLFFNCLIKMNQYQCYRDPFTKMKYMNLIDHTYYPNILSIIQLGKKLNLQSSNENFDEIALESI